MSPFIFSCGPPLLERRSHDFGHVRQAGDSDKRGLARVQSEIGKLLSPPVIGSILGVVVGGTGWIRASCLRGGLASPLYGACQTLGNAYLPAAVLVLAGSLVNNAVKSTEKAGVSTKAVASIMFSRFILAPLTALATVRAMQWLGWLSVGRARAVVMFTLLMEGCMPPAQNSVIMYQLDGLPQRAGKMAKNAGIDLFHGRGSSHIALERVLSSEWHYAIQIVHLTNR